MHSLKSRKSAIVDIAQCMPASAVAVSWQEDLEKLLDQVVSKMQEDMVNMRQS